MSTEHPQLVWDGGWLLWGGVGTKNQDDKNRMEYPGKGHNWPVGTLNIPYCNICYRSHLYNQTLFNFLEILSKVCRAIALFECSSYPMQLESHEEEWQQVASSALCHCSHHSLQVRGRCLQCKAELGPKQHKEPIHLEKIPYFRNECSNLWMVQHFIFISLRERGTSPLIWGIRTSK